MNQFQNEGRQAFKDGERRAWNPYEGKEAEAWDCGWCLAQEEAEEAEAMMEDYRTYYDAPAAYI